MTTPTATLRTRVVFRQFKGEVLALFPEIAGTSNPDTCLIYAHDGQHGAAHYAGVICASKPLTTWTEYGPLAQELERVGYSLQITLRAGPGDWQTRRDSTAGVRTK